MGRCVPLAHMKHPVMLSWCPTCAWGKDAGHHLDGCAFSSAIGTDKSKYFPSLKGEAGVSTSKPWRTIFRFGCAYSKDICSLMSKKWTDFREEERISLQVTSAHWLCPILQGGWTCSFVIAGCNSSVYSVRYSQSSRLPFSREQPRTRCRECGTRSVLSVLPSLSRRFLSEDGGNIPTKEENNAARKAANSDAEAKSITRQCCHYQVITFTPVIHMTNHLDDW